MKVYISGPITGVQEHLVKEDFAKAEVFLESRGHTPVNPLDIEEANSDNWEQCMKEDIKVLVDCDALYMLHNWSASEGATLERELALRLGLEVYYEGSEDLV